MIGLSGPEAGEALGTDPLHSAVNGVSVDTRTLRPHDLFIALRGERFDGHGFVQAAFAAGASGAVVERNASLQDQLASLTLEQRASVYSVPNTLAALGNLAAAVRRRSQAVVIAITGSMGKTGTKDLIRAMAGMERVVLATESNLNNEVGVPLTLLQIESSTAVVVVEMGMRGLGQIGYLAKMAQPDVGVITNIAPVHLELLGSMKTIAQAKAELLMALCGAGAGVIPAGDLYLQPWARQCSGRVLTFGLEPLEDGVKPDVVGRATFCETARCLLQVSWPGGEGEVVTPFSARYKMQNAMAAVAACYAAGLPLEECLRGIAGVVFTPGRGDEYEAGRITILDDSYNANPQAMVSALENLMERASQLGGRPVAVLGDMLELGPDAAAYHAVVGREAAKIGLERLFAVGSFADETASAFLEAAPRGAASACDGEDLDSCADMVFGQLLPGDVVLVKASRRLGLDRLVQLLIAKASAA